MKDMHELEIYTPIKGFPDYLVTSQGRVFSLKYGKLKEIKQVENKYGYLVVNLCKNGKKYNKRVNCLVAQSFIPNPDNKPCVNHIDENKTNNCVSNLEWVTHKENNNHGTHNERVSKSLNGRKLSEEHKQNLSKIKSRKVIGKNKTKTQVIVFKSCRSAEKCGFNHSNISSCCNGKRKSHKGYVWYYADEHFNRERNDKQ